MKKDLRTIRSVNSIKKAFVELLQTKPFNKIRVSEIARKAEIDRQTFYLHYLDKYDLLDQMNEEVLAVCKPVILERLKKGHRFAIERLEKIYKDNLPYLQNHRLEILSLLQINTGKNCLKNDLKQLVIDNYQKERGEQLSAFEEEMIASLYVESFIIFIKEDRIISKEEMEDLLAKIKDFIS